MQPVRTRVPLRTALLVLAAGAVVPVLRLLSRPLRPDLPHLAPLWVVVVAAAWASAAAVALARAVIPPRGEVLPNPARAARAALLASASLIGLGLLGSVQVPGETLRPPSFALGWWHCTRFGLAVTGPMLVVGALALRRLHPLGGTAIGAAVGAAGGALAGLTLHFVCGYGGGAHVGLAHGGGVAVGALLGALLLGPLVRSAGRAD
jgi:hypothetical protein